MDEEDEIILIEKLERRNNNEEEEKEKVTYTQWVTRGNNCYYPETQVKLTNGIPTGYYIVAYDQQASKFNVTKISFSSDKIYQLPMSEIDVIIKDITTFWKNHDTFKRYGLTFKRGILLYGDPGSGKTHIIHLIVKHLIEVENGVVFKIETPADVEIFQSFMNSTFKQIEPNRQIVAIIEDIDGLIKDSKHTETILLNMLDGMGQMDNIVYLATTNYPEELDDRIINRPSRFDRRYLITLPSKEVRRSYFEQALLPSDLEKYNLDDWVEKSDGLSIAHLREIVVSIVIQGNSFEETMLIMDDFRNDKPSSKKFKGSKKIGFV